MKLKTKIQFLKALKTVINEPDVTNDDIIQMSEGYDISPEEAIRTWEAKRIVATSGKLLPNTQTDKQQKFEIFLQFDNEIIAENDNLYVFARGSNIYFYEYSNGVYKEKTELEMESLVDKKLCDVGLFEFRLTAQGIKEIIGRVARILLNTKGRHFYSDSILDQKHYINVKNGLLDPNTGELHPHTPEYFSTSQCGFDYNPDAKIDKFKSFIETIMVHNKENIDLLQEVLGYVLQGRNTKHKLFYFYGMSTRNGKSTLGKILKGILGEGMSTLPLETLSLDNSPLLEPLIGSVLNFSDEITSKYMDSPRLASITSEGYVNINPKYKKPFSYKTSGNFLVACNDMPRFADSSGILSRTVIVPFNYHVLDNDRIIDLDKKLLEEEGSGILYWMLQGLERFNKQNKLFTHNTTSLEMFAENARVNNSVLDYIEDEDTFKYNENCFISNKDLWGESKNTLGDPTGYQLFCKIKNIKYGQYNSFCKELSRIASKPNSPIKYEIRKVDGITTRGYLGLELLSNNGYNL